jgi:hypothetical protein
MAHSKKKVGKTNTQIQIPSNCQSCSIPFFVYPSNSDNLISKACLQPLMQCKSCWCSSKTPGTSDSESGGCCKPHTHLNAAPELTPIANLNSDNMQQADSSGNFNATCRKSQVYNMIYCQLFIKYHGPNYFISQRQITRSGTVCVSFNRSFRI